MYVDDSADDFARNLDQLTMGRRHQPGSGDELAGLLAAAESLRDLDAADLYPDPSPAFLQRLKETLNMNAPAVSHPVSIRISNPWIGRDRTPVRSRARSSGPVRWLATIALLALVAFAATVTFRDVNGPTGRLSTLPAFAPSIPAGLTYEPVDSADCTMSARVSGTTYSLVGETPHQTPMLPKFGIMTNPDFQEVDPSTVMAGLPDADATTISGIGATLHEASACRFYSGAQKADGVVQYLDLDSRYFALFSGDFFRKELTRTMMYGSDATVLEGAWMPIGPASWKVDKASMLPNGRVIAIVSSADQAKPCLTTNARMVMVFEESGGRWYIDEVARVKSPATVACPDGVSQYLDIGITDSLRSEIDATPDEIAFHSDRPITVTVANLGLIPQEFTIDELQISVLIEPGHSASFVLNATRGQYVMASYPSQFGQTDFTNQRLGAILKVVAPGVSTSQG